MVTLLAHSDHILRATAGEVLMAVEPASGVNMRAGGRIDYAPGARFRVKFASGDLIWCLDQDGQSVSFDREDMAALDRRPT